ncbi:MAG: hypothetical protein AAGB12_05330 [Pseudomonadota bacterium]
MKKLLLIFFAMISLSSYADVECAGVPSAVFAGMHGPSANNTSYWVTIPNVATLRLGNFDNEFAKARFTLALSAFMSGKSVTIRYYAHTSCTQASQDKAIPTQMGIR